MRRWRVIQCKSTTRETFHVDNVYDASSNVGDGGKKKRVFDDVVKFPMDFPIKVIGATDELNKEEVVRAVVDGLTSIREKTSLPMAEWERNIKVH